ncbi:hypothetical protein Zmor_023334 [Zophobas morio]|uniref:Major facilitator superfamily (MFS) profile domain-containing protein n=1 Tax=Zophobas morio TaxID=2755281 RepID=A0AA38HYI3_9CUCU|nr:hypothetical protein Zmor_023334 [Zophobas morio]
MLTLTANLLAFTCGVAYGWSSPAIPKLNGSTDPNDLHLGSPITPSDESWIVSLVSIGAIFGPIFAGKLADKLGRKKTLIILACPILVAFLVMAFAKSVLEFYVARFLMGLGVGSVFMILPMYLIEIAEDHNRGRLGCLMAVFINLGTLFAYSAGPYLTVQSFCLVCTVPLIIFLPLFFIWNPESPQYLAARNNQEQLKTCLSKLRNKPVGEIEKIMFGMSQMIQELNQNNGGIKELFSTRSLRKGLTITVGLILFQQFSGINAVLSYMQTIFSATQSGLPPEISTVIVGTIQVLVTIVTSALVDRLGRKVLLLMSVSGSAVSLIALGVYFFLFDNHFNVDALSWLPVLSLIMFIISFNSGLASVPWAVMAEVFPPNVKSLALTLTTVVCFIGASIITLYFPSMALFFGMATSFWIFAAVCICGGIFVFFRLIETKGKSLQEIQELLGNST